MVLGLLANLGVRRVLVYRGNGPLVVLTEEAEAKQDKGVMPHPGEHIYQAAQLLLQRLLRRG